jgi:IS605 OrfB family transposase
MPAELYRTYEVLIEETVHPGHPKRGKTGKNGAYKPEIHKALRVTNDLFQDAVCYYTIMLASLAGEAKDSKGRWLNPLWREFTRGRYAKQAEEIVRRFSHRYASCFGLTSLEQLRDKFLFADELAKAISRIAKRQTAADTYRIIEQQAVKTKDDGEIEQSEALNQFASDWVSILCDPENETNVPGTGILDRIHRAILHDPAELDSQIEDALRAASQWCRDTADKKQNARLAEMEKKKDRTVAKAKTEKARIRKRDEWQAKIGGEHKASAAREAKMAEKRENAYETLRSALNEGLRYDEQKHGHTLEAHEAIDKTLEEVAEKITKTDPNINRIRYGSRDNSFEGVLLRYWWTHEHATYSDRLTMERLDAAKAAVKRDLEFYISDEAQAPKEPPKLNGQPISETPFAASYKSAFPMFLKGVAGIAHKDRSPWWDLDKAAFMYAADDVFKFKRRTQERQNRFRKLSCLVQIGEEQDGIHQLLAENSPTEKKLTVKGMKSDPRREKMIELLKRLAHDKGLEGEYGLRSGTIGGWADVREVLLDAEAKAKKESRKLTEDELVDKVDQCQEENRQGFGSADFFHELCDPDFHNIWSKSGEQTDQAKANQISDFVAYYVRFSEWKDEVSGLQELNANREAKKDENSNVILRPISYTFPGLQNRHGEISQRHFNFKASLTEDFTFEKLLTTEMVDGKDLYRLVPSKELRSVKLAARRLKRDKILSASGDSINALWCPPLVFGLGYRPSAGKKKKNQATGKALKVSLSLVVDIAQENIDWQTVHLKVQLPVSFAELNRTTRVGKQDWSGSVEWNKDGFRRYFRWPIDRLSKALSTVAALKTHDTWKDREQIIDSYLKRISDQTTNAEGKALAKEIEAEAVGVKGDRSKQMVQSAAKALKGLGEKVWSQEPENNPTILSVDLGNRFCAGFARFQAHRDGNTKNAGRIISPDKNWKSPIYARVIERGTLRLQGENAWIWDHKRNSDGTPVKNDSGKYIYEKRPEEYGNNGRGRFPKDEEKRRFEALADAILSTKRIPIRGLDTMTVPEMGDHLIWRLRRRFSRIRNLFKLRWWAHPDSKKRDPNTGAYNLTFEDKERIEHKRMALEMLARSYTRPARDEDEKEDAVYERLRLTLAAEDEWKSKFAEIIPDSEEAEKRKGKSKKKSKDAIREICRSWRIPEAKWGKFVTVLESGLSSMLDTEQLAAVLNEWMPLSRGGSPRSWGPLRETLESCKTRDGDFTYFLSATSLLLCAVMEWCLPLRKRHWHWKADKKKPELLMGKHGPNDEDCEAPTHVPFIHGMRGLSLRRLNQVLDLRQLCQSFAKIERRWLQDEGSVNDLVIKRGEELHDPCPDLLRKSNQLREQRVYQTAHLILTEALGLQLKNPAKVEREDKSKRELKSEIDLHGDYEPKQLNGQGVPRCSVIVLEDLSRYRTSQERTRWENSRLMEWAHRKIINKLADLAKPFGITLMLVDPAWSSRFDSRTGVGGIRVKEVTRGFENEMPFAAWRKRIKKNNKPDDLAELVTYTMNLFDSVSADAKKDKKRTLLIPVEGGELFLPAKAPADDKEGLLNADENAAVNIGLRALAHPDRLDIFSRLRTVKKSDGRVKVGNKRGYFACLPENDADRELRFNWSNNDSVSSTAEREESDGQVEEMMAESSEYPDYFALLPDSTDFGIYCDDKCLHANDRAVQELNDFAAYQRPLFLKRLQQVCFKRIENINDSRLADWKAGEDQIP